MATVEQLTIQFEGKGAPKLTGQLNALSAAMNRLAGKQTKVTKATKGASKATDSYNQRLTKTGRNVPGLIGAFGKFGQKMSQMRSQLLIVAFALGTVAKIFSTLHKAVSEFQVAQGKLNGVLKSTGFVAGKTRSQLEDMANSMQKSMGTSNTAIMEMQARLLTFTNIVGNQFNSTIKIATDMSNVLGTDLNGTIIQVGKALQDPILGLTSLRRVGVNFTEQQKEQIKTLTESGQIVKAQKLILSELKVEFGGATDAINENARSTKALKDLQTEWGDTVREIGLLTDGFVITLLELARGLTWVIRKTVENNRAVLNWIATFAQTGTVVQKGIKTYLEFAEVTAALSTSFTKFRTNLGGYSEEVQVAAKANGEWTSIEKIQEWTNSITEAMSKDKRAEITDKVNEALLTNKFILSSASQEQKAYNETVENTTQKLKDMITEQGLSTEKSKMEFQMGTLQVNGLRTLTDEQQELIDKYFKTKEAIEAKIQAQKDAEAQAKAEIDAVIKLQKAQENSEKSLKETATALRFKVTFGREMTEVDKLMIQTNRVITKTEIDYAKSIDDSNKKLKDRNDTTAETVSETNNLISLQKQLANQLSFINRHSDIDISIDIPEVHQMVGSDEITKRKMMIALLDEQGNMTRELTEEEIKLAAQIDKIIYWEEEAIRQSERKAYGQAAIREQSIEFAGAMFSSFEASSNAQMQAVQKQQQFELDQLRNSRKYQKASDKQKQKLEEEVLKRNKKNMQKAFNDNKNARYAQVIIDTHAAVTAALANEKLPWPAHIVVATMIGAMGAQQLAGIKATKAPKFAYGGLVGGSPHSQGGTMVEAERGEFVVRKAAVDALGLEALNRINAGGGGGSVNVNISGNVLSKDFIEDEAIPQIKEAIRRGADIGIG